MQKRHSIPLTTILSYALLTLGACIFIVPFLWMLLTSIKTLGESVYIPPIIFPSVPRWDTYSRVLATLPFLQFYQTTVLMTLGRTLGQLVFCSLAAYAFARIQFPGRTVLFLVMLSALMIPSYALLLPQYVIMRGLGWVNSLQALIVPGLFSSFGTFLLRQFFLSLPTELDEAAKIDGAHHLWIYWHIILPLARPGLIALAITTIIWSWNDLLWPLVINNSVDKMTLSVGLASLQGEHLTDFPVLMAGAVLASWPVLVIFIIFQRSFVEGIALTGSKG